ncbi:MAG TPA: universal stress protein [Nannocystis exedens]|nr:universal stress protein [Nannocystis exedens]
MKDTTRWLVGLDLQPESSGVLSLASWLTSADSSVQAIGVHVVETGLFGYLGARIPTILDAARERAREALGAAGVSLAAVQAVEAESAEIGLLAAAKHHRAAALLIGRWSRMGSRSMVRLGRVARRILRELPLPVVVTPPDLRLEDLGEGPVIIATDLSERSEAAAVFAAQIAARYGRALVAVHVGVPQEHAALYVLDDDCRALIEERHSQTKARAKAWVAQHIAGAECVVVFGAIESEVLEFAEQRHALMIVCGSRGLSLAERIFASSTASSLAGHARCPVAVVPGPAA